MTASDAPPVRRFYAKRVYIAWSLAFVVLAAFYLGLSVARGTAGLWAVFYVAFAVWMTHGYARVPLVEVFADRVVLRYLTARIAMRIALANVIEVREPWKHTASLVTRVAGEEKRIDLPLDSMESHEQDELLALLRATLAAHPASAVVETPAGAAT